MPEGHGSFIDLTGTANVYAHEINTLPGFGRIIAQVDGIERYDRILSIARPQDVALLKAAPDPGYLDWLDELGLGTRRLLVLKNPAREVLPVRIRTNGTRNKLARLLGEQNDGAVFCPYYAGPLEEAASDHLGLPMYADRPAVERFDSKIRFRETCQACGVPVVEGTVLEAGAGITEWLRQIGRFRKKTGIVLIRGEFGASASTTYVFTAPDRERITRIVGEAAPHDRFLVEPFLQKCSSPSTNWFLTRGGKVIHLRTSNQLLEDGISHAGNEFPLNRGARLLQDWSRTIAARMHAAGFVGPFGIDFLETEAGFFATECNPRVTGAMYPWEIVRILEGRHGPIPAARSENVRLRIKGIPFVDIRRRLQPYLYDGRKRDAAVFPFNTGPLSHGKFTLLTVAGSKLETAALVRRVTAVLNR